MLVLNFTNPLFYYHVDFRVKKPNKEPYLFMSCFSNWINCYPSWQWTNNINWYKGSPSWWRLVPYPLCKWLRRAHFILHCFPGTLQHLFVEVVVTGRHPYFKVTLEISVTSHIKSKMSRKLCWLKSLYFRKSLWRTLSS